MTAIRPTRGSTARGLIAAGLMIPGVLLTASCAPSSESAAAEASAAAEEGLVTATRVGSTDEAHGAAGFEDLVDLAEQRFRGTVTAIGTEEYQAGTQPGLEDGPVVTNRIYTVEAPDGEVSEVRINFAIGGEAVNLENTPELEVGDEALWLLRPANDADHLLVPVSSAGVIEIDGESLVTEVGDAPALADAAELGLERAQEMMDAENARDS
ncbi:hypothetical protein GCM10027591_08680 [Zhihengliuella somnathii]